MSKQEQISAYRIGWDSGQRFARRAAKMPVANCGIQKKANMNMNPKISTVAASESMTAMKIPTMIQDARHDTPKRHFS
jgi:hypothetical protein